jgi:hypothetical protein
MGIPVIVAAIFFAVDEILQKERNIGIKAFFALVPMIITGIVLAPSILEKAETKRVMHEMDMNGPPQPVINVNGMTADIERPNACWDSDGSTGCPINKDPYILPIDPVGIDEFKVSGGIKVKIKMNNTDQDFILQAYYIHQNEAKEIKGKDNEFELPENIQEQVVQVTAIMGNTQRVSFVFGIRNGIRPQE